ncbi:MAG TPA: SpoIIE family protein phosphatase [Acidobacteriota bacterium]|nr:SpoIIE family protein phosphatase [Acidobacteriota bacterium]
MDTFYLKWLDPAHGEQLCPLSDRQIVLGRRSDCEIVFRDPYVSRRHARIVPTETGYRLEDLNSTHGTYVGGKRVFIHELQSGDLIQIGTTQSQLLFFRGDPSAQENRIPEEGQVAKDSLLSLTSVLPPTATGYSDLEKLSYLLDFQYNWGKSFSVESTFRQILDSALKVSGAERGFILLREGDEFRYMAGLTSDGTLLSESEFQTSRSLVQKACNEGVPVFMTEGIDQEFASQQSIVSMQLRAVACMPLRWMSPQSEDQLVRGILYLDSTRSMHALSGLDQKILSRLAIEAAGAFERLEMIRTLEERKVFEKELALARETQRSLLPQKLPQVRGYTITAFSQPTHHVGGDFYDFPLHRSLALTAVVADVSGKGISAALLSSLIQGALETECRAGATLDQAFDRVNEYICQKTQPNRFVTLFAIGVALDGQGEYVSAGHNPAYLFRASTQSVEVLEPTGIILGAFEQASYESFPITIGSGDVLLIYSDGLTEAMDPAGEMFGEGRLEEIVRAKATMGAQILKETILDALNNFTKGVSQTDDVTFVIVEKH